MRSLNRLRRAVLLMVAVLLLLQVAPVVPLVNSWLLDNWDLSRPGDTLIVLGCEQQSDGIPGISTYWRTVYAVRAWRQGRCARLVFSGGRQGGSPTSLAFEMGQLARALGVPPEVITLEENSQSTRENALAVVALVRDWPGEKTLMTSDYHMRRSRRVFERAGLKVRTEPAPDLMKSWSGWSRRWECLLTVSQEVGKFMYYAVRGWV